MFDCLQDLLCEEPACPRGRWCTGCGIAIGAGFGAAEAFAINKVSADHPEWWSWVVVVAALVGVMTGRPRFLRSLPVASAASLLPLTKVLVNGMPSWFQFCIQVLCGGLS